ncbi:MAG: hypothetical protein PHC51_01370 [bacterium]|nr:hypothetical protein [bacterium]
MNAVPTVAAEPITANSVPRFADLQMQKAKYLMPCLNSMEDALRSGMFINRKTQKIGAELEVFLVDRETGAPANLAVEVVRELVAISKQFQHEATQIQVEYNASVFRMREVCFQNLRDDMRDALQLIDSIAAKYGAISVACGTLPSSSYDDLLGKRVLMTPLSRYRTMSSTVQESRLALFDGKEDPRIVIPQHSRDVFEMPKGVHLPWLIGLFSSYQMHLEIPYDKFGRIYNWFVALAGIHLGATTGSGVFCERLVAKEIRSWMWRFLMGKQLAGFPESYLEEDNLAFAQYMRRAVEKHPVLLDLSVKGEYPDFDNYGHLNLHNGTVWEPLRGVLGREGDKLTTRIEVRWPASGPTPADMVAHTAMLFAATLAFEGEAPAKFVPFGAAKKHFMDASFSGLDFIAQWSDDYYSVRHLLLNMIIPRAREILQDFGIDLSILEPVKNSVSKGVTPADWIGEAFILLVNAGYTRQMAGQVLTKRISEPELKLHPEGFVAWPKPAEAFKKDIRAMQKSGEVQVANY